MDGPSGIDWNRDPRLHGAGTVAGTEASIETVIQRTVHIQACHGTGSLVVYGRELVIG